MTFFAHPDLVRGTLREGFAILNTVPDGLPRAIFVMFLVAEVHPFADGNGRVALLLMNAELSAQSLCRVMIPLNYRDEYMSALRALSQNASPTPLWRMIDRAQRWASLMTWTGRDRVMELMQLTNFLATPPARSHGKLAPARPRRPERAPVIGQGGLAHCGASDVLNVVEVVRLPLRRAVLGDDVRQAQRATADRAVLERYSGALARSIEEQLLAARGFPRRASVTEARPCLQLAPDQ